MLFFRLLEKSKALPEYIYDKFWSLIFKKNMIACGKNVMIKPLTSVFKGVENFVFADRIRIARYAVIYSTNAKLFIGSNVDVAPYLKIITGNHRFDRVGHFMFDGDYDKLPENDKDVIIEGDNWLGVNVTILSGVTIGRGSIVAAGAVVVKPCPPYSILVGVPAKVVKARFSIEEILKHESALYPEKERLSKEYLSSLIW